MERSYDLLADKRLALTYDLFKKSGFFQSKRSVQNLTTDNFFRNFEFLMAYFQELS